MSSRHPIDPFPWDSMFDKQRILFEASEVFERCLTIGNEQEFLAFIERLIVNDPPLLSLLREIATDLQQRLLLLREHHFDVRDSVVRTLSEDYGVDIRPLCPNSEWESYHLLDVEAILEFGLPQVKPLDDDSEALIRKMVSASLRTAQQLYADMQFTSRMYTLVADWIEALSAEISRQYTSFATGRTDVAIRTH